MFFFWIFPAFFLAFFVLRFAFGPRWGWCGPYGYAYAYPYAAAPPPLDAREELRQRLARGDITPEEYERQRDALGR